MIVGLHKEFGTIQLLRTLDQQFLVALEDFLELSKIMETGWMFESTAGLHR
ncbi:MAG TPA: hypothetical protein VK625_10490 [Flavitalea sp.]|nr:hypothetical protein [Flavitalea sp.]